jgi:predicted RNA-binding protein YlqC (UPF0109 family)
MTKTISDAISATIGLVKMLVDCPDSVTIAVAEAEQCIMCTVMVDQDDISKFTGKHGTQVASDICLIAQRLSDPVRPVIVGFYLLDESLWKSITI